MSINPNARVRRRTRGRRPPRVRRVSRKQFIREREARFKARWEFIRSRPELIDQYAYSDHDYLQEAQIKSTRLPFARPVVLEKMAREDVRKHWRRRKRWPRGGFVSLDLLVSLADSEPEQRPTYEIVDLLDRLTAESPEDRVIGLIDATKAVETLATVYDLREILAAAHIVTANEAMARIDARRSTTLQRIRDARVDFGRLMNGYELDPEFSLEEQQAAGTETEPIASNPS